MGLFKWHKKKDGDAIEHYLDLLCSETPAVALALLAQPIKNVKDWLTDDSGNDTYEVEFAECGCLIGATLIAVSKVDPDAVFEYGPVSTRTLDSLQYLDGEFGGMSAFDISEVGMAVYREVYEAVWPEDAFDSSSEWKDALEVRENAMVFFIKNTIRKNLGIPQLTKPE